MFHVPLCVILDPKDFLNIALNTCPPNLTFSQLCSWVYVQSRSRGPRQPWHDLHCKIDGPAAYDIMTNFEQRWRKATKNFKLKKVAYWHDDALIKLDRISWILTPSFGPNGDKNVRVTDEEDPENWHVQVRKHIFLKNSFIYLYYIL